MAASGTVKARDVSARFSAQCLRRPNLLDRNARRSTACDELVAEGRIVPRRADEQTAGVLDAVGGGLSQDDVLRDALLGRVRVFDRVAAPGVEQPMEAAGGAVGQVLALDEHRPQAAHGRVTRYAGAGRATTDHERLGLERRHATRRTRSSVP
jgi:hypothetical protein